MRQANDKPRVAILLGAPFTPHHFARLGIPHLAPHCDIQVIDCACLLGRNPDAVKANRAHWDNYVTVRDMAELRGALAAFTPAYAIDDIGLDVETAGIRDLLTESGARLVCVKSGALPRPGFAARLTQFLRRQPAAPAAGTAVAGDPPPMGRRGRLRRLADKIAARLKKAYVRRVRMVPPDIALVAGSGALDWFARRARRTIWIGSEDYHTYAAVAKRLDSGEIPRRSAPFILFIDVCLPYAADWQFLNIEPPISAAEYYPLLRALFDRIETVSGLPVVIAAHPNALRVDGYRDLIGGRELVFGETAALAVQCSAALTHASTATSFAVLAQKPVLFVTSGRFGRTDYGRFIAAMAHSLAAPLVTLENSATLTADLLRRPPDRNKYDQYTDRYLCSGRSTETIPWQGFIELIGNADGCAPPANISGQPRPPGKADCSAEFPATDQPN